MNGPCFRAPTVYCFFRLKSRTLLRSQCTAFCIHVAKCHRPVLLLTPGGTNLTRLVFTKRGNYVNTYIEARFRNHFCRKKERVVTYSECVSVALVIHYAKRKGHIILPSADCLNLPYTFAYHIKSMVFGGIIEHKMRVLTFTTILSDRNFLFLEELSEILS
jgi:hypothetical protein